MNPTREIRIPGAGRLPPSTKPLIPSDIAVKEVVRVFPPSPPWFPSTPQDVTEISKKGGHPNLDTRYWKFGDAFEEHPAYLGQKWLNDPGPGLPGTGSGWGLDRVPDTVLLEVKGPIKKSGLPDLWHSYGGFVVSERLLTLLREVDADAIAYRPIIMYGRNGATLDNSHYFLDVVRNIPAVDFANSIIDYHGGSIYQGERSIPYPKKYVSVRFVDDIDPNLHIFRQEVDARRGGGGRGLFVSSHLKGLIEELSPPPRNIMFGYLYAGF